MTMKKRHWSALLGISAMLYGTGPSFAGPNAGEDLINTIKQQQGGTLSPTQQELVETIRQGDRATKQLNDMKIGMDELQKARVLTYSKNYKAADPLYRVALSKREAALGARHALVAEPLSGLAKCYLKQGWLPQAAELYKRAIAIGEQSCALPRPKDNLTGPTYDIYAFNLGNDMNQLADLYRKQGKLDQSEATYKHAMAIDPKLGPMGKSCQMAAYRGYAELLRQMSRDGEALKVDQQAEALH